MSFSSVAVSLSSVLTDVIVRSNHEHDYFGTVLEYDYFALYSRSSTVTQKVRVQITITGTPSLIPDACSWLCAGLCG